MKVEVFASEYDGRGLHLGLDYHPEDKEVVLVYAFWKWYGAVTFSGRRDEGNQR